MRLKDKLNVIVAAVLLALSLIFVVSAHAQVQPNGISAPTGYKWVITYDEEFTNESDINHSVWSTAQNYSLSAQNGLALQGLPNNTRAQLVTGDPITQRYGAWEWLAQFPHNDSGEGTGYHADLYLGDSSAQFPNYIEDDVCEWDTAFTPATACQNAINDTETNGVGRGDLNPSTFLTHVPNGGSGSPPIGDAFHTWGMYWANDGTAHGTVSDYFDGVQQTNTIWSLTNPRWDQGARPIMEEDNCSGCSTSSNNPLLVKYFRVWQLVQVSSTPTPTPSPAPTPSNISTYLIGSAFVIDGGFYKAQFNFPPAAETYSNNQPNLAQQYQFKPSGSGFTVCNISFPACLTDGGTNNLIDQGQGTDVWTVLPSGSNWTLQNQRTGRFMGAIPQALQPNVPMSATAVAIPLTLCQWARNRHPDAHPNTTPTPTPTSTPSPNCSTVTTTGPTLTDSKGQRWSITASAQVAINGVTDTTTSNVVQLVYTGAMYQKNTAGNWYVDTNLVAGQWVGALAPTCSFATPTPLPPTPTPTIAPTPTPLPPTPTPTSSPTPTPGTPVCDGTTDDTAALNAQFAAGPSYLPFSKTCYAASALTTRNDIDFNGAQIHSGITSGCALTVTTGQNMYSGPNYTTPTLVGNGIAGTSGLCINGNHIDVDLANISGFGNDVQFGNFAYSIHFLNPYLYGASGTAFYFPTGLSDAGEGIVVEGGSIFNSTNGVVNYGGSMFFNGTSIDSISNLPIDNSGDLHFKGRLEMSAALPGAYVRVEGSNAYGHVTIEDSEILNDPNQGSVAVENDGTNTYVKVINTHFSGFPVTPAVTGSNATAVGLCNNTLGNGPVNNIPNQGPGC